MSRIRWTLEKTAFLLSIDFNRKKLKKKKTSIQEVSEQRAILTLVLQKEFFTDTEPSKQQEAQIEPHNFLNDSYFLRPRLKIRSATIK